MDDDGYVDVTLPRFAKRATLALVPVSAEPIVDTYTVTVTYNTAATINCPDPIENVPHGVFVESVLNFGTTEYKTGCYFTIVNGTALMTPAYTYRIQKENGAETFRMTGSYSGANFHFEKLVGGDNASGNLKLSGTYFDNNEFHQSLRTVTTFSTNFRPFPSPRSPRSPMTASKEARFSQKGSNSSGRVCPSESVWKI